MSQDPAQAPAFDAFSIFNTKIEDIKSFEEEGSERLNYDEIYYEPDPEKAQNGTYVAIVKLLPNITDPTHPVVRKMSYKLPNPNDPRKSFHYDSPSTVKQPCPVVDRYWQAKDSENGQIRAIGANLKRKRKAAVAIQIISDKNRPDLEGQVRLLRFTEDQRLDKLIKQRISPTAEDIEAGVSAENVFDPFFSRYLVLKVQKGDVGRDFDGSMFTESDKKGGMKIDGKILTDADRNDKAIQQKIVEMLSNPLVSLAEHFAYKAPDEERMKFVNRSLRVMFGEEAPGRPGQPAQAQTAQQPAQPVQQQPAAQPAPQQPAQVEQPAPQQQAQPQAQQQPATAQANPAPVQQPAAPVQNNDDFLASLGV